MRTRRKLIAAVAGAAAVLVVLAAPAGAHVTVDPSSAAQGSFTALAFRVPNETTSTNTVKVDVKLPDDHPLAFVSVKPHDGWTFTTAKTKLATPITTDDGQVTEAVSEITWTATGPGIAPGEYDDFEISVGPLPTGTDSLPFKAIQTYSDGSEVSWIEQPDSSGKEPDHPAPVLQLTAGGSDDGHAHDTSTASSDDDHDSGDDSGDDSKGLAVAALVVGAIGVVLGGLGLARSRPRA